MNFRARTLRNAAAAVAAAGALVSGAVIATGTTASADGPTTAPWQAVSFKDPNAVRTLTFYDASGAQITSGSTSSAIPFVAASGAIRAGDDHATLYAYTPVKAASPVPGAWSGEQLTTTNAFPLVSPPAGVPNGVPVLAGSVNDVKLSDFITDYPNASTDPLYQGAFELRLRTSSAAHGQGDGYAVADIVVSGSTWHVYDLTPSKTDTTTTEVVPATGTYGTGFQVTATVSAGSGTPAGNVTLKDGSTTIGSAVALDGSGHATFNVGGTALAGGTHSLTVSYPGSATFNASASTASPITIAKADGSITATVPSKATYGTAFKIATTVTGPATPTGTATLKSGSVTVSTLALVGGKATFTVPGTKFAPGSRAFTVTYNGSQSLNAGTTASKITVIGKAIGHVTNALSPKTISHTKSAKLTVKVTAVGTYPTGTISIYDGSKLIKTVSLTAGNKGTVVITLPKLKKGSHAIHAVYGGSGYVLRATASSVTLKST